MAPIPPVNCCCSGDGDEEEEGSAWSFAPITDPPATTIPVAVADEQLESESSLFGAKLPELLFRFTALVGEDLERDELEEYSCREGGDMRDVADVGAADVVELSNDASRVTLFVGATVDPEGTPRPERLLAPPNRTPKAPSKFAFTSAFPPTTTF